MYLLRHSYIMDIELYYYEKYYPRNPFLKPFGTICCWLFAPVRQGFIRFR